MDDRRTVLQGLPTSIDAPQTRRRQGHHAGLVLECIEDARQPDINSFNRGQRQGRDTTHLRPYTRRSQ